MTALQTAAGIIELTMQHLLPAKFDGAQARVQLIAQGLQESEFTTRQQFGGGPARSYWQMEQGGGIRGVLTHPASKVYARAVCSLRAVAPVESDVYAAFLSDDPLACAFARLLLWTDAAPLPATGDSDGAWRLYQRVWRPGKPRPETWSDNYTAAVRAVQ